MEGMHWYVPSPPPPCLVLAAVGSAWMVAVGCDRAVDGPMLDRVPDCPVASDGAVCNGHGTCVGLGVGASGGCDCTQGWNGTACTNPPSKLVNCTSSLTSAVASYSFVNGCNNPLRVFPCASDTDCAVTDTTLCQRMVFPQATMVLLVPDDTHVMLVQVCKPGSTEANAVCMEQLVRKYVLDGGSWQPALALPNTQQVYCETSDDCLPGVRDQRPCTELGLHTDVRRRCPVCLPSCAVDAEVVLAQ